MHVNHQQRMAPGVLMYRRKMSNRNFKFPLQKALDWYRQVLTVEQAKLQRVLAELREIDQNREELSRKHSAAQHRVVRASTCFGSDLQALARHLTNLREDLGSLMASKRSLEARMTEQRRQVTWSLRRVRQLEKLEERRREDWTREVSVQENLQASELFLATMVREKTLIASAEGDE